MPIKSCHLVHSWTSGVEQFRLFFDRFPNPSTAWVESSCDNGKTWKRNHLDPDSLLSRALYALALEAAPEQTRHRAMF